MKMLIAALALAFSSSLSAFQYKQMPFDEMAIASNFVVIAEITATTPDVASARVLNVLKGPPDTAELQFLLRSGISEADPNCCRVGGKYLLFLRRDFEGAHYSSTNGRFGVVEIR